MSYTVNHYINGRVQATNSDHYQDLINPATNEVIGRVGYANQHDVDQAVGAAQQAFPQWAAYTPIKRARILFKYKELIESHRDELALLVTREHGKTLDDARGSVQRGLEVVEFACGIAHHLSGDFSADVGGGVDSYSMRQPLGVCAGITPFNFPAMVPLWMFPMAIACGNTFVLKPSEKDPSCPQRLVELLTDAGVPPGVVNVVHGDKTAVDGLLTHPIVRAVSFVGSSPVAQYVYQTAAQHHKRVQAFGSAKNHGVVMPDANMEQTVDAIVGAAYGSAGERCMALSVIVAVGESTADVLIKQLVPRIKTLKIDGGEAAQVDMGPLVSKAHLQKVLAYVEKGVSEGAQLVVDGRNIRVDNYPHGNFLGGCLFDYVTPEMTIYQEEIFGPVLCIMRVSDFAQALQIINHNPYGNGTAIFTQSGEIARAFAAQVDVGMVGINVPIPVPVAYHSFGGWKHSVFGDIGVHGMEGVRFYTKQKKVTVRWPHNTRAGAEFAIPVLD
ncbi:MAG: CoA-acylating methylmalonate-semialdehyde dehydrogenase [Gammaproteobacteria bacterium]